MIRVDYYLAERQITSLKKLSTESGLTVSEIVRRAIDDYLLKHPFLSLMLESDDKNKN